MCVNKAREVITDALAMQDDFTSGLEGEVDDFVSDFEPQIAKCEAKFEQCEAKLKS